MYLSIYVPRGCDMSSKVTMQDIADALNLSRNTVSKAINNTGVIAESTKKLILQKAVEMGYRNHSGVGRTYGPGHVKQDSGVDVSKKEIAMLTSSMPGGSHFAVTTLDRMQQIFSSNGYSLTYYRITKEELESLNLPGTLNLNATAAMFCMELFHYDYCRMLAESFGNADRDQDGWYVKIFWPYDPVYMQEICSHPLLRILKTLLGCGLDPRLRLDKEDTDVMNELMYVDVPFLGAAAMRLLMEHGADPYIQDSSGEELYVHLDSCMAIDIDLLPDRIVQSFFQCWLVLIGYGARPKEVEPFHLYPEHTFDELKEFEYYDWKVRYEPDKHENIMHIIDIRTGNEIGYL